MSVLMEFSITPLGKGESVSKYVARAVDIIDKSGLNYRLGPMGTCVEGNWDELFGVLKRCFQAMKTDCCRIMISIKVDYRKGSGNRLQKKIAAVEKRLGKSLRKSGDA